MGRHFSLSFGSIYDGHFYAHLTLGDPAAGECVETDFAAAECELKQPTFNLADPRYTVICKR